MVERGGRASLLQESFPRVGIVVITEVGYLQGYGAFEMRVLGQVDRAHAALPQSLDNPVAAELFEYLLAIDV